MPNFTPIDLGPASPDQPINGEANGQASGRMHVKMFRTADDVITEASTDIELAREFIAHGELSPKSVQNTQKELYRFLTWCREEAGKTLCN
jgi:integrase/recombinase XerD